MLKVIATDVVISKGFEGNSALRFSENGSSVQFKFGKRVYDTRAANDHRYINMAAKAFGAVCERIQKMKLKEGSYVHIMGRLDEETWDDNGQKVSRFVVIVEDIDYASTGGNKSNGNGANATNVNNGSAAPVSNGTGQSNPPPQNPHNAQQEQSVPPQSALQQSAQGASVEQSEVPPGFTGYNGFGGDNPFFPNP